MTIEIEIQNSKLKSKIKIEKVSSTGIKSQKLKSNWLAPIGEHIGEHITAWAQAGVPWGFGRLGLGGQLGQLGRPLAKGGKEGESNKGTKKAGLPKETGLLCLGLLN